MYKHIITFFKKLNKWYDNLKEPKRFIIFLIVLFPILIFLNFQYHITLWFILSIPGLVWFFSRVLIK